MMLFPLEHYDTIRWNAMERACSFRGHVSIALWTCVSSLMQAREREICSLMLCLDLVGELFPFA